MKGTNKINGNWPEIKGKLKLKFALLTEDDLWFVNGNQDELIGRLRVKLGKTKTEIEQIISNL